MAWTLSRMKQARLPSKTAWRKRITKIKRGRHRKRGYRVSRKWAAEGEIITRNGNIARDRKEFKKWIKHRQIPRSDARRGIRTRLRKKENRKKLG